MNQFYTDCRTLFKFLVEVDASSTIRLHITDNATPIATPNPDNQTDPRVLQICLKSSESILSTIDLTGDPNDSRKRIMCSLLIESDSVHVRSLNFSNNFIRNIIFSENSNFENILVLNISSNPLEKIDISRLSKLQELYVSENEFDHPLDLSVNKELRVVDLRKVSFHNVMYPDDSLIETLCVHGIRKLDVTAIPDSNVPDINILPQTMVQYDDLKKMKHLKKLELVDIFILSSLSLNLDLTPNLEDVRLIRNELSELKIESNYSKRESIYGIKTLVVTHNNIETLILDKITTERIMTLDVSNNKINGQLDLSAFFNLSHVSASCQHIDEVLLPTDLNGEFGLKSVNLANNNIKVIDVSDHVGIKHLILGSNLIQDLDLSHHDDMETLDLSENKIKNVSHLKISKCCIMLKRVDVSKNNMMIEDHIDLRIYDQLSEINISDIISSDEIRSYKLLVPSKNIDRIIVENTDVSELVFDQNSIIKKTPRHVVVRNNRLLETISMDAYNNNQMKLDHLDLSNNPKLCMLHLPSNCSISSLSIAFLAIDKIRLNGILMKIERISDPKCVFTLDAKDLCSLDISGSNFKRYEEYEPDTCSEIDLTWLNKINRLNTIILKGISTIDITFPGDYSVKNITYVRSNETYTQIPDYLTKISYQQLKSDLTIVIDRDSIVNAKYSGLPGGTGELDKIQKGYMTPKFIYLFIGIGIICIIGILLTIIYLRMRIF